MIHTHSTAVKVDVYPEEFRPIMQCIRFSLFSDEFKTLVLGKPEYVDMLESFLDDFTTIALNEGL
jgi:hypothetical protein